LFTLEKTGLSQNAIGQGGRKLRPVQERTSMSQQLSLIAQKEIEQKIFPDKREKGHA